MTNQNLILPSEEIKNLCQRYRVRELALFGSVLRDDFHADSDVDLLVEFEPDVPVGFMTLARMQRELSAILHRQVDVVPKGGLKPRIRQAVLASAEVLYAA
jgi:predicted nucleotidyltransferase